MIPFLIAASITASSFLPYYLWANDLHTASVTVAMGTIIAAIIGTATYLIYNALDTCVHNLAHIGHQLEAIIGGKYGNSKGEAT